MVYTPSNHLPRWKDITYTYDARGVRTTTVRPVSIVDVSVTPSSVTGGTTAQGTVTLSSLAPAGGALVMLTSDRAAASTPSSVTVLSGQTAAVFAIMTIPVSDQTTAVIKATFNGSSAIGSITVNGSRIDPGQTSKPGVASLKRAIGSKIVGVAIPAIKPLAGQDEGPPPQSSPTLFERQYTFYTPELNLLSETASTFSTTATSVIEYDYIWFGGQPLAQIENVTGNISWYFNDHLGTPIRQTNATGHVIWHAEYEPYGTIYAISRGEARHQPLRLPGQTAEEGSDLFQNVFRFYRAGWGRYTQVDPIGISGDINIYRYATSNALRYTDVWGLKCCPRKLTYTRIPVQDSNRGAFAIRHVVCADVGNASDCTFQQTIDLTTRVYRGENDPRSWVEPVDQMESAYGVTRPSPTKICFEDSGVGVGGGAVPSEFPIVYRGSVTVTVFDRNDRSDALSATWSINITCNSPGNCRFSSK
jgi:RHS repeat-associated protein